jgi:hypothetical protein
MGAMLSRTSRRTRITCSATAKACGPRESSMLSRGLSNVDQFQQDPRKHGTRNKVRECEFIRFLSRCNT